jgi:hypothetical protein
MIFQTLNTFNDKCKTDINYTLLFHTIVLATLPWNLGMKHPPNIVAICSLPIAGQFR